MESSSKKSGILRMGGGAVLSLALATSLTPVMPVSSALALNGDEGAVLPATTAVASVDGVEYDDLSQAFESVPADGVEKTIKLLSNITMSNDDIVTTAAGQNIVFDLNGYSITVEPDFVGRPIENYCDLTITGNGSIDSSASVSGGYGAINNFGSLTILNGHFSGNVNANGSCIYNRTSQSTLLIEGGVFENSTCVIGNKGQAEINGGFFYGTSCSGCNSGAWAYTITNWDPGDGGEPSMVINDGVFTGVQGAASSSIGELVINGGQFTVAPCENNHQPFYALYVAGEDGVAHAVINGGTFVSEATSRPVVYVANDNTNGDGGINEKASVEFNGGKFVAKNGQAAVSIQKIGSVAIWGGEFEGSIVSLKQKDFIFGGSFSSQPSSDFIADGYEIIEDETGHFVADVTEAIAEIGSRQYPSLSSALNAAEQGDCVKLLKNTVSDTPVSVPDGVVFDGSNFEISCSSAIANGAFVNVGNKSSIRNLVINTNSNAKHGVQFYCVDGGSLENVAVNGGYYTSVIVNGAQDVNITDCQLNPEQGAYANIEFAMGSGVTAIPSMTVEDVAFGRSDIPLVWVDASTVNSIVAELQKTDPQAGTEDALSAIEKNIANNSYSDLDVIVGNPAGGVEKVEVDGTDPDYFPGGGGVVVESYDVAIGEFADGKVTSDVSKAEEGDKVTLTVAPDAGFELAFIAVVGPDGQEVELKANADGTYSFEMPDFDVEVKASFACDGGELCPSHKFEDVDQDEWYHDAIDWAVSNKVLNGFDDTGLMMPDGEVTRAQMAQILWNVEGRPAVSEDPGFSDVADSDWFDGAVAWAAAEGIFEGYDGTDSFGPNDVLTREQAAAVLMRWTEANGGDVDARADLSGYPDASSVDEWAVEYVSWAVAAGVISGVEQEDGTLLLDPLGTATRAQTAMLMMRLVEA